MKIIVQGNHNHLINNYLSTDYFFEKKTERTFRNCFLGGAWWSGGRLRGVLRRVNFSKTRHCPVFCPNVRADL